MSRSVNRVTLVGHLGKDAESKFTTNGTQVAGFAVATSRRWKDGAGEWKEETDWHSVVWWKCEKTVPYLKKGTQVYVEGHLRTRSYDKGGETKYVTEVVVDELILLGGKPGE